MSVKDYNKADPTNFGNAIGDLVAAITGNGVGQNKLAALMNTVTSSASAMNELKDVPVAAGLHVLAGAGDRYGDVLVEVALAEEAATP